MKPLEVRIIVPVFNCETYLAELMDALRSQADVLFEIIAVNDGSDDSSLEILSDIALKDSRLMIINQSNQGLSAAEMRELHRQKGSGSLLSMGTIGSRPMHCTAG